MCCPNGFTSFSRLTAVCPEFHKGFYDLVNWKDGELLLFLHKIVIADSFMGTLKKFFLAFNPFRSHPQPIALVERYRKILE